jgi:hypothetical protein
LGRAAVLHTVEAFRSGGSRAHVFVGNLYVRYARFSMKVSQSVARRQELAADRAAVRLAGRNTTAAALRQIPLLDAAHGHYVDTYALMGMPALEAGTLPVTASVTQRLDWPDLVKLRAVVDARGWAEPLQKAVQRALRTASASVTATGDAVREHPPAGGAAAVFTEWMTAVTAATDNPALAETDPRLPGLEDVLDAIDGGLLWMAVADRMPKPDRAARLTGQAARNFIRPRVWDALAGLLQLHLIAQGLARPDVSWRGRPGLALPDEWEERMDAAIDAAVDDAPDTTALRGLLARDDRAAV